MKLKYVLTIIILFIFNITQAHDENISVSRKDSISKLQKCILDGTMLSSYGIGQANSPSKQYQRFVFLIYFLNKDEFGKLFNESKGCLKLYSYMALLFLEDKNIETYKTQLEKDTTLVYTGKNCIIGRYPTSYIVENINRWYQREQTKDYLNELRNDSIYRESEFTRLTEEKK